MSTSRRISEGGWGLHVGQKIGLRNYFDYHEMAALSFSLVFFYFFSFLFFFNVLIWFAVCW